MDANQSFIANVAILNAKLREEAWFNTFWAPFSGTVDISKDDNGNNLYRPSGKPIEILEDFVQEGRDNMLIPFLKSLTGAPVFGDTTLKGTGEQQSMYWLRTYVNQVRKAVEAKSGSMAEQRAKIYKLMEAAKPQLADWFAKYNNQEVSRAFYEGVSQNLSKSTAYDGLGLYKRYHPNFYYNANGTLTAVGTEKYTKTATNLNNAVTGMSASSANFGTAILRSMRTKCMQLKIPKIVTKSGHRFWALLAHPASTENLLTDSTYTAAAQSYYRGLQENNPEFAMAVAYYADFAIFEDIVAVRGWDDATGGFFGDDDTTPISSAFDPTTVTDNYCSIIFGNGALGKGVAERLHFTNELDDHENVKEIGGAELCGYNRADFVAEASATESSGGLFQSGGSGGVVGAISTINQSSAILMTGDDH